MGTKRTAELDAELIGLIETHQRILRGICRAACPRAPHDQEDLYQEITIRALQAYPSFRHESKFSTWLRRVAYNTVSVWRRNKKLEIELDETVHDLPEEPPEEIDPDNKIDRLFASVEMWDGIILAMILDGEDNATIAANLGMKPDSVRKRLDRLKKRIMNLY
ncbi:MAG: sigma-70 family RNA polymerase sigma factor [Bacteroidetes bacterium]|nr:sigma-70 family RNA polymerase sigma factor [Bacteroidota bacterium]